MLIKIGVDIGTVSWEGLRSLTFDNLNYDMGSTYNEIQTTIVHIIHNILWYVPVTSLLVDIWYYPTDSFCAMLSPQLMPSFLKFCSSDKTF